MQIKESHAAWAGIILLVIGWIFYAIHTVGGMQRQIEGLQGDVQRLEVGIRDTENKLFFYIGGNQGPWRPINLLKENE